MPLKIVLVGTFPPTIGGTTVSLDHLKSEISKVQDVELACVHTGEIRSNGLPGAINFVKSLWSIFIIGKNFDIISLHLCYWAIPYIGPIALLISQLIAKPIVFRLFGGRAPETMPRIRRMASMYFLKSVASYLLQTKQLIRSAKARGLDHTTWYPTSRPLPETPLQPKAARCSRYIFLGQIKRSKGIDILLSIDKSLPEGTSIDIHGPLYDYELKDFEELEKIRYCGVVDPKSIYSTLEKYDALLLPSSHPTEGYPGVIIESFMTGTPIICTRWLALPEIVDESCGILTKPGDPSDFLSAIKQLSKNESLFKKLQLGSFAKRDQFASDTLCSRFLEICVEVKTKWNRGIVV